MSGSPAHLLSELRRLAAAPGDGPATDAGLLRSYALTADPEAFAELVRRHGPVVLGVCRRVLGNAADADDAFQASFLVLARKAGSVGTPSAGSWLYGVARHMAVRLRDKERRRTRHERAAAAARSELEAVDPDRAELLRVLDEELARLPDGERAAVLACHVRGLTQEQAAAELGWSLSTVRRRLESGRERLRERLTRRLGVGAAALTAGGLTEGVSAGLVEATRDAAAVFVAGGRAGTPAAVLAQGVLTMMTRVKLATVAGLVLAAVGVGAGAGAVWPTAQADDPKPAAKAEKAADVVKKPAEVKKPADAAAKATADDLIRPGERLRITMKDSSGGITELGEVRVEPNGKVPLGINNGGRVLLGGQTVEGAEAVLVAHQRDVMKLKDPIAEVIRLDWTVAPKPRPDAGKPTGDVIRPSDRLAVQIGAQVQDQIAGIVRVEPGGTVALGVIYGRVAVAGLTVDEAEAAIGKAIATKTGVGQVSVQVVIEERAAVTDGGAGDGKLKDRVRRLEREVAELKAAVEELRKGR